MFDTLEMLAGDDLGSWQKESLDSKYCVYGVAHQNTP